MEKLWCSRDSSYESVLLRKSLVKQIVQDVTQYIVHGN